MKKNIFMMSKVPIKGNFKKRLSKQVGFIKSKRLICNNIEKIHKLFLRRKAYSMKYYVIPYKKFRSFSFCFYTKCILQSKGSLGDKMWHLIKSQQNPLIIIGSDIPKINLKAISYSFKILRKYDVVIGPTYDGGFWLIGYSTKKKYLNPFKSIRWSTTNTLSDLIINLKKLNLSYEFTHKLRDIDNKADYCENSED